MSPLTPKSPDDVAERLAQVEDAMQKACRQYGRRREEVGLVAVSKMQPDDRLHSAVEAGLTVFGENYPQELARKAATYPSLSWHLVGRLQRNKVKLVDTAALIHSVDSERLLLALDRRGALIHRAFQVLVQVHLGQEATKGGVEPEQLEPLLEATVELKNVEVSGLMTLPPPGEGRRHFAELRRLRDRMVERIGRPLPHLSMGMSDDFPDAIAEGATWIRVGTRLFGARPSS